MTPYHIDRRSGFTLVELAIVMTIIGLLIGGILKGQELMLNARISATIAQVKSYQAAVETFRDMHSVRPGDFPSAQTRLPGCTVANSCFNGNGNSLIGIPDAGWQNIDATIAGENTQFWKHLAAADLISGIIASSAGPAQWGFTHPASRLNGGFHVREALPQGTGSCYGPNMSCINGTILVLRLTADGSWSSGSGDNFAVRPNQAALIDRKMDDGMANLGYVHAVSHGFNTGCGQPNEGLNGPNGYDEQLEGQRCDVMFKF